MTLYATQLGGAITTVAVRSQLDDSGCSTTSRSSVRSAATPILDLSDQFSAPFSIRVLTSITLVSPASGLTDTRIVVTGTGFLTGNVGVLFDGVTGLDIVVLNDSTILVTVPALPLGPVNITVNTAAGTTTRNGGVGGFTVAQFPPLQAVPALSDWVLVLLSIALIGAGLRKLNSNPELRM